MSKQTEGIVLIAFNKRGYSFAAVNLAMSIRTFDPKMQITLLTDDKALGYINNKLNNWTGLFNNIKIIPDKVLYGPRGIDPAKVKTHLYDLLPYHHNLYLDVDACALKSLQPLMEHLKAQKGYYLTDVRGTGKFGEKINYGIWAPHAKIWPFYGLKKDAVFPAIQSSFAYIRKTKACEGFFQKLVDNYEKDYPIKDLSMQWGGTMPDELLFSVTCAQKKLIPDAGVRPIFFGNVIDTIQPKELAARFYLLSIYGNGTGDTLTKLDYLEMYDRLMMKYYRDKGFEFRYKYPLIMQDKHANNRV